MTERSVFRAQNEHLDPGMCVLYALGELPKGETTQVSLDETNILYSGEISHASVWLLTGIIAHEQKEGREVLLAVHPSDAEDE